MSGLIKEEIPEWLYDRIKEYAEAGNITEDYLEKTYLTNSTEIEYGSVVKKSKDRFFATRIDFDKLTPGEVLKITISEIENLKKAFKKI